MSDYLQKCDKLYELTKKFIDEHNIWGDEYVYQSDRVIENAPGFIAAICDIVGYKELEEDDA
jgi:hypothetical protein